MSAQLQFAASVIIIVEWSAECGRSYEHREIATRCDSCGAAPYAGTCELAGHAKWRHVDTQVNEPAPEEARQVRALYTKIRKAFATVGHCAGGNVYVIPKSRVPEMLAVRDELLALAQVVNSVCKVCRASFHLKTLDVNPDLIDRVMLDSLKHDVESAVTKIVAALASTDRKAMRDALRETQNVAALMQGNGRLQTEALGVFTSQVADRLKAAAKEGQEAVELVAIEARQGAMRFAGIFGELLGAPVDVVSSEASAVLS